MIEQNDLKEDELYDVEAERTILGTIIGDYSLLNEIELQTDDFYDYNNKKIYDCMKEIHERGDTLDVISLAHELKKTEIAIDMISLGDIVSSGTLKAYLPTHCKIVKEYSLKRTLIKVATDIISDCKGNCETEQLINNVVEKLSLVVGNSVDNFFVDAKKFSLECLKNINELIHNPNVSMGISTGYTSLDDITKKLKKGCLYIIAGRPGMGKTALGLNIASNVAIGQGMTVAIFSLEMTRVELCGRIISMNSLVKQDDIDTGKIDAQQWNDIVNAYSKTSKSNIFIDDSGGITLSDVRSRCLRLNATNGLDLIVIDYLQLMRGNNGRRENRQTEIADISNGLKALAKELSCPIICLSQLNREADGRAERRPLLSDLRDSGAIEQDADGVLMVYRDSYYYPEEANDVDEVEILVRKMRNGKQGTVILKWYPEYCLFSEEEIDFDTNTPTSDDSISKSDSNTNITMENDETGFYEWNGIDEF